MTRSTNPLVAVAVALLAACEPHGNGVLVEEARPISAPFVGVDVSDGIQAFVTVGPAQEVRVLAESNLIERIGTDVGEPELVGSTTGRVLHVRTTGAVSPTITPSVLVSVPSFLYARAVGGSAVQLRRPSATAEPGPALTIALDGASLTAVLDPAYVTSGAAASLSGAATARLHSDGPVVAHLSGTSRLENTLGAGPCYVTTTASTTVLCNAVLPLLP